MKESHNRLLRSNSQESMFSNVSTQKRYEPLKGIPEENIPSNTSGPKEQDNTSPAKNTTPIIIQKKSFGGESTSKINDRIKVVCKGKFTLNHFGQEMAIRTSLSSDYENLKKFLVKSGIQFHTFTPSHRRETKAVLKGLPQTGTKQKSQKKTTTEDRYPIYLKTINGSPLDDWSSSESLNSENDTIKHQDNDDPEATLTYNVYTRNSFEVLNKGHDINHITRKNATKPIYIQNYGESTDQMAKRVKAVCKKPYTMKFFSKNISVKTISTEDHKALLAFLKDSSIQFHTFSSKPLITQRKR
ncbi:hypothetical protein WDU94_007431 [Cyamophila willieti]